MMIRLLTATALVAAMSTSSAIAQDRAKPTMSAKTIAAYSTQSGDSSQALLPVILTLILVVALVSGGNGTHYYYD